MEYKVDSDDQSIREFAVLTDINLFDYCTVQEDQTEDRLESLLDACLACRKPQTIKMKIDIPEQPCEAMLHTDIDRKYGWVTFQDGNREVQHAVLHILDAENDRLIANLVCSRWTKRSKREGLGKITLSMSKDHLRCKRCVPDSLVMQSVNQHLLARKYAVILRKYCIKLVHDINVDVKQSECPEAILEKNDAAYNDFPLAQIAHAKLKIVHKALQALECANKKPVEQIQDCLRILKAENNKTVLSQRRDSWLVKMAKTVCDNVGLTWLYRALMGCEVTEGIQHVNMFAKQSQELGIQLDSVNAVNGGPRST